MFFSPLVKQIVDSLGNEPEQWTRRRRTLARNDGTEIQFITPYGSRTSRPRLIAPREVAFGPVEAFVIGRAIRRWLHRPI